MGIFDILTRPMNIYLIISTILLSTVKISTVPIGLVLVNKYPLWEIALYSASGGVLGSFVFFYLTKYINLYFKKRRSKKTKTKKIKWKKNRRLVNIKNKFGLIGLSLSIGIVSVPVGAILLSKYYGKDKRAIFSLIASSIFWGTGLTYLTALFM